MSSKNNPEARNEKTKLRAWKGKTVKPVLFIEPGKGRYMAAMFEDGNMAMNPQTNRPLPYKDADKR